MSFIAAQLYLWYDDFSIAISFILYNLHNIFEKYD